MITRGIVLALGRHSPMVLAAAGLALVLPGTGLAVGGTAPAAAASAGDRLSFLPFTPAGADPRLAARVAAVIGEDALRFTPAVKPRAAGDRTVNVAVRVDRRFAASLARPGARIAAATPVVVESAVPITASRYDLGIARGYQSFAKPAAPASAFGGNMRDIAMPDLSTYAAAAPARPSRFNSRIALGDGERAGTAARLIDGGSPQVDVQTSYRLGRNLDVTAGVRLSQDRDRLAPLTDGAEDDQSVYVGTQIRF